MQESELRVRTPHGNDYGADGPELVAEIEQRCGKKLTVVRMGRGAYHSMPVSLISTASIQSIEQRYGSSINPRRFRMNVYIETTAKIPYEEEQWIGKILSFGDRNDSARIMVIKRDERCATINLDPETGESDAKILKALVQENGNTLGVYCTIIKEGTIHQDDSLYIAQV